MNRPARRCGWRSSTTTSSWSSASPPCSRRSATGSRSSSWTASLPVLRDVDVILYDTFGQVQGNGVDVEALVDGGDAKVVIYSWNLPASWSRTPSTPGASATCPRGWTPRSWSTAIEQVHAGERVVTERRRHRRPPGRTATGRGRRTGSPCARRRSSR